MANKQINAILSLKDRMSAPLLKVASNVDKVSSSSKNAVGQINRMGRKFENTIDGAIKSTFKWTKRVAAIGGGLVLKVGFDGLGELEDGAAKVKSIARDALEIQDIQKGLLQQSTKIGGGLTPKDIAEAQYQAISAGIAPELSLDFTDVAAKMKVAGFTDITSSIDILTSTMNAFNLNTLEDANRLADEFLYTQNKGVITVDDMAQYYGKLIPMFSSFKLGTEDMNVAIATVTKMGLKPAEAVTSVSAAMRILSGQSSTAVKNAAELGVVLSAKELQQVGFAGKVQEIIDKTGGDIDKIISIFPNARALLAGLNLTSEEGVKIFADVAKGFQESSGLLNEAFETMANTIPYRFKSIRQTMKNYITEFFADDRIRLPILDKLIELDEYLKSDQGREAIIDSFDRIYDSLDRLFNKIVNIKDFIVEHKQGIQSLIKGLAKIYITIKSFRALGKIFRFLDGARGLLSGFKLGEINFGAVGKAALVVFLIAKSIQYVVDNLDELKERYPEVFQGIENLKEKLSTLWGFIVKHKDKIIGVLRFIKNVIGTIIDFIVGTLVNGIFQFADSVRSVFRGIGNFFSGLRKMWENRFDLRGFLDGMIQMITGAIEVVEGIWGMFRTFITAPISAVVDILSKKFEDKAEKIKKTWNSIREFLSNPISGTVNLLQRKGKEHFSTNNKPGNSPSAPKRYTGDRNWRGGVVQVSERGGEVLDLPSGTRIYPHDESVQMAYKEGQKGNSQPIVLNMNIHGNVYGEEELIDRVGNEMVRELKEVLPNMA